MAKTIGRPGAIGSRKNEIYANYDTIYGKDNWRFVWKVGDSLFNLDEALELYDEAYHEYFANNPDELDWIAQNFENVYDNSPSNVNSGFDYKIQEFNGNHFQDISIRRCVRDFGLKFQGKGLLEVREGKAGSRWSPSSIPFHEPTLIETPEFIGWWKKGSVESFYQSNKYLEVNNVPDYLDSHELFFASTNKGKLASAQRSLGDSINIGMIRLEICEEQESIEEIAKHKAKVAYSILCRPVLCDDSAFVIPALGNYPGPHVKRELEKNGIGHFIEIAKNYDSPDAYFEMTLAYMDSKIGVPALFTSKVEGNLIPELRGDLTQKRIKSKLFGCFVPKGHTKTLAEFTDEEYKQQLSTERWDKFKEFYFKNKQSPSY